MFQKEFWKTSASHLKNVKYLAIIAIFIAMKIIVGNFFIPVSENLRVGVNFLLVAIEASILGPVSGMVSGALTDLLGFALFPDGAFFPGYTLTAMCGSLIYALFLYRTKITITRLIIAKVLNNYLVNVLMGSLWSSMLYGKAYIVYATASVVKNTVLLPIEVILLVVVFTAMLPLLQSRKLIPAQNPLPLKWK